MRMRVFVSFNEGRDKYRQVRQLLESIDCLDGLAGEDRFLCGLYQRTFDADDVRLEQLRATLRSEGIEWSEREDRIYTDAELRSYPLLCIGVARKPIESGGPEYGTTYDLSEACPQCGTGAVQTSPLMLRRAELPRNGLVCETCRGQVLVATKVADVLKGTSVSGLELRQARSCRDKEPLPWWQMMAPFVMPRVSSRSESLIRDTEPLFNKDDPKWGCPICERDMYATKTGLPLDIVYERSQADPDDLPDAVQTWECFGRSVLRDDPERCLQVGFAEPLLLVKPKVFDVLRKLKVREASFVPVRFID
jgi:hypothetical protein